MRQKISIILLVLVLSCCLNIGYATEDIIQNSEVPPTTVTNVIPGIIEKDGNKYYQNADGSYHLGFKEIDGKLYFFSRWGGAMRTGVFTIDGVLYGFNEDGTAIDGVYQFNNNTYYFKRGQAQVGFQTLDGKTYYFDPATGVMQKGIISINGTYYGFNEDGTLMNGLSTYQGSTYYGDNGKVHLGFKEIDGKLYFFSRWGGAMRTGVFIIDGVLYGFNEDGSAVDGVYQFNNNTYYFKRGQAQMGFQTLDGKTYYFDPATGVMQKGIISINGTYYGFNEDGTLMNGLSTYQGSTYYGDNGKVHLGFKEIDGKKYFFSRWGGAMRTGVFTIDGVLYGFNEDGSAMNGLSTYQGTSYYGDNGKIHLGFKTINGKKYFFSRWGGAMRTGIFSVDGVVYGFNDDGTNMSGMIQYQGKTYFFNNDGTRYSGFKTINGKRYFFGRVDGTLRYGWFWCEGYHYYATTDGSLATGDIEIDGMVYHFTEIGRLKLGWSESNGKTYFLDENAKPVTDWQVIDGVKCFFNSLGELIKKDAKYIIDVSTHQGKINWDQVKAQGLVDGVIVRVGYGSFYEDEWLAYNISELKRLGIPYGIYIFSYAENEVEAKGEANGVLSMITKYNLNPTLGIYYDIEDWDLGYANSNNISVEMYDRIITTFINHLKANGYDSYVYANLSYIRNRLSSSMRQYIRWIAQYNHNCTYDGEYFLWQYSSSETVSGINGRVDGNVWFK